LIFGLKINTAHITETASQVQFWLVGIIQGFTRQLAKVPPLASLV